MNIWPARRVWLPLLTGMALLLAAAPVIAQEQFFTQSGGRGLQNAKTNARLSKVEGDVDVLNVEMAKVKPHAKAELGSCPDSGDKLRYTGTNWVCDRETDPTVQGFAKKALPTCTGTSIIGVVGGEFSCVQSGFVSDETDPTVQGFAKSPLPNCGQDQVLTVNGSNQLSCMNDQVGLTRELDPQVHDFARRDTHPSLPNCGTNEMLTMTNGNLSCRVDTVGITVEVDPAVADFARKDIAGYTLAACGTGEILRAVTETGKVILKCEPGSTALADAFYLNDLKDVNTAAQTSGTILRYNGTEWIAGSETDPTVPGWAKSAISTCGTGQTLTGDGTSLTCVDDAGGASDPIDLVELGDVRTGPSTNLSPNDKEFLRYDSGTSKWVAVHDKLSATQTSGKWCYYNGTDVVCDRGAPSQCGAGDIISWNAGTSAFGCVSGTTALGLGDMAYQSSNTVAIHGGSINGTTVGLTTAAEGRFTNLRVTGNFYVSGTQTIDGVSFLNGGVNATGTITATTFVGDGSGLTGISAGNLAASGNIGDVQIKGITGEISATNHLNWNEAKRNLGVSGTVQVAGSGAEVCDAAAKGTMRVVDIGAGDVRMQFCRP